MNGTKESRVSFSNPQLAHIRDELERHNITVEQLCRALEPHFTADDVTAFLADEKLPPSPGKYFLFSKATTLSMTICSTIQDIADARRLERHQVEESRAQQEHRYAYIAPRHPGIEGREVSVHTCSRGEFLELVKLSQPELVDGLTQEADEESAEADSAEEEDDEQETMNENTTRTIGDAIIEADEFTRIELPDKRMFLYPWLTEQSIGLINGWRGVGKTGFAMGLIEAISRGQPFGPWQVGESVPCLYLEGEMPAQDIQERLRYLTHASDRKSPLYVYSDAYASHLGMPRAHLANPDWRKEMKSILLAKGVKLWVVDNLASLTAGIDENSKKDWDPINAWLLELRFAGIATYMPHHVGKGGTQRGTSAREDNVDVSMILKRPSNYKPEDGARFIVKFEKARVRTKDLPLLAPVEFRLIEDEQGRGAWVWKHTRGKARKVEVLEMLHEEFKYDAIKKETGISKGRITQIKKEAEDKGWLDNNGKLTPDGLRFVYGGEDG
jgi:putative DNA primase/helicase